MANQKLQDYLRDILTLEVTTVVVDRIPDLVTLDLGSQVHESVKRLAKRIDESSAIATEAAPAAAAPAASAATLDSLSLDELFARVEAASRRPGREAAMPETAPIAVLTKGQAGPAPRSSESLPRQQLIERVQMIRMLLPTTGAQEARQLGGSSPAQTPEQQRMALQRLIILGDQPIGLHTTLSVGGDIVNLVARELTGPESASVRQIHGEGVSHAIGWWRALAELVADGLGRVLDALSPARR